jgi:hypothetical protein
MFFCLAFAVLADNHHLSLLTPCQDPFLSNFRATCTNGTRHYCSLNEWTCMVRDGHHHGHHDDDDDGSSLSAACLGNSYGCLLTVDQQTGACFGHCAEQSQIIGLLTVVTLFGIVVIVLVAVFVCVGCCCCCGCCVCLAHWRHLRAKKKRGRNDGTTLQDFIPLPDGTNPQQPMPVYPQFGMPGAQVPRVPMAPYFGQYAQPGPGFVNGQAGAPQAEV